MLPNAPISTVPSTPTTDQPLFWFGMLLRVTMVQCRIVLGWMRSTWMAVWTALACVTAERPPSCFCVEVNSGGVVLLVPTAGSTLHPVISRLYDRQTRPRSVQPLARVRGMSRLLKDCARDLGTRSPGRTFLAT